MILTITRAVAYMVTAVALILPGATSLAAASPWPEDALTSRFEAAADFILDRAQPDGRPFRCILYGAGEGRLAWHLASRSTLRIVGVCDDAEALERGRRALRRADAYGRDLVLHQGDLAALEYSDYSAWLVVSEIPISEGRCPGTAAEMLRLVRPDGGMAIIGQPAGCPETLDRSTLEAWLEPAGLEYTIIDDAEIGLWAIIVRPALEGAGQWTHPWADIGNTACSGDTRTTDQYDVLWFGEPGPRIMVDRHWRAPSPLYSDGRYIVPAEDRIVCLDAYNGARLWDFEAPRFSRVASMRTSPGICMDDENVYLLVDSKCLILDLETGKLARTLTVPAEGWDWGYLAVDGSHILGSMQTVGASYLACEMNWGPGIADEGQDLSRNDNQPVVLSRSLFCMDKTTGEILWTYDEGTVIPNGMICADGESIYFLESNSETALAAEVGRAAFSQILLGDAESLVALNRSDGTVRWREPRNFLFQHIGYLSCADGVLLASGCRESGGTFVYDFDAAGTADGATLWTDTVAGDGASDKPHGKQDKHPLIVGDQIIFKYGSLDLKSGERLATRFATTNCADVTASMKHVFTRNTNVTWFYNIENPGISGPMSSVIRPGCYLSMLPVGGLVVMPPFSAGCTCDYHTLITTIAWQPR